MSFSLFRCGDETYVAVPQGLSPPIEAIRLYGASIFVRAIPRGLYDSEDWTQASSFIDEYLFAVVGNDRIEEMFDLN